ncbi:MAG: hypothetical protein ACE5IR_06310 [bacterium]
MRAKQVFAIAFSPLFLFSSLVFSQSETLATKVLVRAIARDAKIIGTSVGGARIKIRDLSTGEILVEGIQEGKTGDTKLIMKTPRERGATLFDTPGAAGFLAKLHLSRPTVVEISAEGPLDTPQSTYRSSKTLLLVPGKHILGEGVLLEIHGFRVSLFAPNEDLKLSVGQDLPVRALITMT